MYVYDVECMQDFHSCVAMHVNTKETLKFVIHEDRDDRELYFNWLESCVESKSLMIGYNNIGYDYHILVYIIKDRKFLSAVSAKDAANLIKNMSNMIIEREKKPYVREFIIPQIDLYKLKHYDSRVKATSLKYLEYAMDMDDIEDMPFPHHHSVTKEQINKVLDYNDYDVKATFTFYQKIKESEIDLRASLSEKYGLNLHNSSEPNMAKQYFGKFLSQKMGIPLSKLKEMRTKREMIDFSQAIPDFIQFETPILNDINAFLKKQKIPSLKGYFEDLPYKDIKEIEHLVNPDTIIYTKQKGKRLKHLNVKLFGVTYYLGKPLPLSQAIVIEKLNENGETVR